MSIDWTKGTDKVSKYFTVKEALWLPQWNRMATAADGLDATVKENLIQTFEKMDLIREFLGTPIIVHCAYRPEEYNKLVGGAKNSAHKSGQACDWHAKGVDCDDVRGQLRHLLEDYNIRMEDLPNSNWVHIDTRAPGASGKRFFKP